MIDKNKWRREYRAQKKARGECYDCPSPSFQNKTYCKDCLLIRAFRRMNERMQKK